VAAAEEFEMQWVTREHPKTDRIACPWLIRKFIDPNAEIVDLPRETVLAYAQRQLELELPVYDALYAWARHQVHAG
jgi:hypothetical protein